METETQPTIRVATPPEARLRQLGLIAAADKVKETKEMARKLRIAFEFYRVVEPNHIARFNEDLKKRSGKTSYGAYTYDALLFTPLSSYKEVPPDEALKELEIAIERNCFDSFEVATIQSVKVVPDPLLFGRINNCENRYFIAQWDEDVKIDQLLKEDEG